MLKNEVWRENGRLIATRYVTAVRACVRGQMSVMRKVCELLERESRAANHDLSGERAFSFFAIESRLLNIFYERTDFLSFSFTFLNAKCQMQILFYTISIGELH